MQIKPFRAGATFKIGKYTVHSIPVTHPVESCGFIVSDVGGGGLYHDHGAGIRAELPNRIHGAAIVVAIGVRLNHNGALDAEPRHHLPVLRDRSCRRRWCARQRLVPVAIEMQMGVALALDRNELWRRTG